MFYVLGQLVEGQVFYTGCYFILIKNHSWIGGLASGWYRCQIGAIGFEEKPIEGGMLEGFPQLVGVLIGYIACKGNIPTQLDKGFHLSYSIGKTVDNTPYSRNRRKYIKGFSGCIPGMDDDRQGILLCKLELCFQ